MVDLWRDMVAEIESEALDLQWDRDAWDVLGWRADAFPRRDDLAAIMATLVRLEALWDLPAEDALAIH